MLQEMLLLGCLISRESRTTVDVMGSGITEYPVSTFLSPVLFSNQLFDLILHHLACPFSRPLASDVEKGPH